MRGPGRRVKLARLPALRVMTATGNRNSKRLTELELETSTVK
jgi:hypothetical protein